jgi:hypothetical protein
MLQIKKNTYKVLNVTGLTPNGELQMAGHAALNASQSTRIEGNSEQKTTMRESVVLDRQQRETAQYIADMILELRNMAKSAGLYQIMVPLEFAYYEAFSAANRVEIPKGEVERIHELSKTVAVLDPATAD